MGNSKVLRGLLLRNAVGLLDFWLANRIIFVLIDSFCPRMLVIKQLNKWNEHFWHLFHRTPIRAKLY